MISISTLLSKWLKWKGIEWYILQHVQGNATVLSCVYCYEELPPLNSWQTKDGKGVVHLPWYFSFLSQGSLIHSMQNIPVPLIQQSTRKNKTTFISPLAWISLFVRKSGMQESATIFKNTSPQKTKTTSKNIINPNNQNQATYYPHCLPWDSFETWKGMCL